MDKQELDKLSRWMVKSISEICEVVSRIFDNLFDFILIHHDTHEFRVTIQFVKLCNEQTCDLLTLIQIKFYLFKLIMILVLWLKELLKIFLIILHIICFTKS
jgi:hypothetical protein